MLDECSKIDIMLMYDLLKAIPPSMTLIMVGDTDQLPSVGAGNVLADIIRSAVVPVVRLQRIFRQAQGSRIIMNAHRIDHGKPIDMSNGRKTDFFFDEKDEPEAAISRIIELCAVKLPRYYHVDPMRDIQVLTPRPCLIICNMPKGEKFFRQTRRFDAGILVVFQGKSTQYGGKRAAIWAC